MDRTELEKKIEELVGLEKRYYEFLPDPCWMSEETQAKGLNVGRGKIRTVKRNLKKKGLIRVDPADNGKRQNLKHIIRKTYPIILSKGEQEHFRYEIEDNEYYFQKEIDWSLLQTYTAQDINGMKKSDKVRLYLDCGFIVLPTHYPIFTAEGVKCSCSDAFDCSNKGKHPLHRYKWIDGLSYDNIKDEYIKEFDRNSELNIGFKVSGYSVLDVDNRHDGDKSLESLAYSYDLDLNHVISVNCSNGAHIYLSNKFQKNTAGVIGKGLDIRSEGGFIVAAGSRHYSGRTYEWKEMGELATLPEDLFEEDASEVSSSNVSNPTTAKLLKDIKLPKTLTSDYVIPDGEREMTLFKWACSERGKGADANAIYDVLITIRDTYCEEGEEPVTDEEIRRLAVSVAKNYPANSQKNSGSFNSENN